MKKLSLYIFLVLMFCNASNAIPMKGNGQGDLVLSEDIIKEFHSYVSTRIQDNPLNFFITADYMNVFIEIRKDTTYKGYSGSGPISRNKKKCEQKYKQDCFLFANQRIIVWNNGINPIDTNNSKIKRTISYDELIAKLNELGFETKKQKAAKEKQLAEEKAAKEKQLAEEKAAKEKQLAEEKAAKEKQLAEEKAAKEKKLLLLSPEKQLEMAQKFLVNIREFIKIYPDEFDTIKLFEFILITRPIMNGNLDNKLKEDLKLFIEFTNKSNEFVNYQDEIEKNIEKKEPEVKKEEVKKEEVKKEEVKKEEVKKEEVEEVIVNNYFSATWESKKAKRNIDIDLPNCEDHTNSKLANPVWENCYGIRLYDQGDGKTNSYEGKFQANKPNGRGIYTFDGESILDCIWKDSDCIKLINETKLSVSTNETQDDANQVKKSQVQDCSKVDASSSCNKNTDLTETVAFLVNGDLADKNDLNYRHWSINSCVLTRSPSNMLSNMRDTVDDFNKVIVKSTKFYKENNYSYAEADCSGECTRSPTGPDSKFIYQSNVAPKRLKAAFNYFFTNFCEGFKSKF